ncbi:S-adenosylmethionine:tRNA ribosyltransferase-isomerase [hydrothermal vent metagenome]|uniref:S-adenosylmethionine:tRNA ribosyltransferase-isomerase n=1 Tax=hydrothermal vent metagenome TaxID=652676 RepID=A0A3B0YLU7_9ZZZZ
MNKSDFQYDLPPELIAQHPPSSRGQSRMLVMSDIGLQDSEILQLPHFLREGDLLVVNDTKVIPARLYGHKDTGGKVEVFLERILNDRIISAHIRSSKKLNPGQLINIGDDYAFTLIRRQNELFELELTKGESLATLFEQQGHMPLPPYIKRADDSIDQARYQTLYADSPGAVAAPTAGLHFSEALLNTLKQSAIKLATVTLHVGSGTFAPMRVEDIDKHKMHHERYVLSHETCKLIQQTKEKGGRIIAVGTTVVRTLESIMQRHGDLIAGDGETNIFIYPGYEFKVIDGLLTNFHLPESTLIMLVCAFAGFHDTMHAYQHAVQAEYRFFSYGDAMLILPE